MSALIDPRTDFMVLKECADWLVVGKPAPLLVHPTSKRAEETLLGELQKIRPDESFFFINRLDRETSGCVLIAKNSETAGYFGKEMIHHRIGKSYHAIVRDWPRWQEIEVNAPLRAMKEVQETEIWVRQMIHEGGKESRSRFVCEERFQRIEERFSVLRCIPETGRTHQLRVHLEHLGHPIVGDKIYGGDSTCYLDFLAEGWHDGLQARLLLDRQALHASEMEFTWQSRLVRVTCPFLRELEDFRIGG